MFAPLAHPTELENVNFSIENLHVNMLKDYNISVIHQCDTELFQELTITMLTHNTLDD